ncbi:MAG: hypothetical protein ACR2N7_01105 [Acidimicrobiia bacterium]
MSEGVDWASRSGSEPADGSGGSPRPPIWVVIVVVVSVVAGGWLLATQGSSDGDTVAGTTIPFESDLTTTTTASVATTLTVAPVDASGFQTAAVAAGSSQQLQGHVAVASPDSSSGQGGVWVFRPGGSVVSRVGNTISSGGAAGRYPMLITAGHLIVGNQIFDIDLAEPPISLWTDAFVVPGSGPGVVWLARRRSSSGFSIADWVAQFDVESLAVGEQIDLTDLALVPNVGVADGLIVGNVNDESHAYWSPTGGLVDVGLPDELGSVLTASGNVVVVSSGSVDVLDIVRGELVSSFGSSELPDIGRVASACLSPDGQHVIVVGSNGEAVVGNTATGQVVRRLKYHDLASIQRNNGIGWTTDDQIVFIAGDGDPKDVFGFDIAGNEPFHLASLHGSEAWWLTASGTVC